MRTILNLNPMLPAQRQPFCEKKLQYPLSQHLNWQYVETQAPFTTFAGISPLANQSIEPPLKEVVQRSS